jgi:hypothetical protein
LERIGYDEEDSVNEGNGEMEDEKEVHGHDGDDHDGGGGVVDRNAPARQSSSLPPGFQARWPRVQLYWLHLKHL